MSRALFLSPGQMVGALRSYQTENNLNSIQIMFINRFFEIHPLNSLKIEGLIYCNVFAS